MNIKMLHMKGFRNFKDSTINFKEKSLLIGSNDVGKTNLLYALRILLDRSLSDSDIEPKQTDFYAYEPTNELSILICFSNIVEDCIIAKLREYVSDEGNLMLEYKAFIDTKSNYLSYKIFIGKDDKSLVEIENRFYLRFMNLKFIGSRRDLIAFIRQEKQRLLEDARDNRDQKKIDEDTVILGEIESGLSGVNEKITSLSFVQAATDGINSQLGKLSYHNQSQNVVFDVGASDPSSFIDDLHLASKINGKSVVIGGEGRNNQIHLALWSTRNQMRRDKNKDLLEVCFFCIEEPEAHLHPHQQRKLAKYLSTIIEGQVIMTSHSPQIACEVPPSSIIRLYFSKEGTVAAGNGINPFIEEKFIDFGYRLSIMSSEVFFSDLVFLVEGPSEEVLYKALADTIGIDLDMYNISVLKVDGVGFKPYASLLSSLRIPFVIMTDNDIFKIPKQEKFRLAGVQRAVQIFTMLFSPDEEMKALLQNIDRLSGFDKPIPPQDIVDYSNMVIEKLQQNGIFLSGIDLEHDLFHSIPKIIADYLEIEKEEDIIAEMQKRKATFMFDFVKDHPEVLAQLIGNRLAEPLKLCKSIAEAIHGK